MAEVTDKEFHDIRVPPLRDDLAIDPGRGRGIELVKRNEFRGVGPYSDDPGGDASSERYRRTKTCAIWWPLSRCHPCFYTKERCQ